MDVSAGIDHGERVEKLPYLTLVLAFALIYVPRMFVLRAQAKEPGGLDNAHPRAQQAKLTGLGARAQGAHMNGFESFAPFAAGVLACELARVDVTVTGYLGVAFVAARSVYVALYLGNVPTARTAVWMVGFAAVIALLLRPLLA